MLYNDGIMIVNAFILNLFPSRLLLKFDRTNSSVNIFGIETIYLTLFLPIAASPLFCFGYLYCIALFYVIVSNDILQRALQSATRNCKIDKTPLKTKTLNLHCKLMYDQGLIYGLYEERSCNLFSLLPQLKRSREPLTKLETLTLDSNKH